MCTSSSVLAPANYTLFLETPALAPEVEIPLVGHRARLLGLLSEARGLHAVYLRDEDPVPSLTPPGTQLPDGDVAGRGEAALLTGLNVAHPLYCAVLIDDARWVDVPPVTGALAVNVGDLLELVSNDRFKSAEHRVVVVACHPPGSPVGARPPRLH
ncbi:hypothetical protein HU200_030245 [Digitaria exilis]|uniref:Isopenicillin N synthase-like Fe(2+) 2OG dioxygenase domain-containing protein n=1 Tax=Digitaria exilis TaxID=1010633 RepID=A0A835BPP0_9POAL|nr:hypothetical protein HU200_030245 [Digitaria exilis]